MIQQELDTIVEQHQHWLKKDCEGWEDMKADLREANLSGANLSEADLSRANLSGADLVEANLVEADLRGEKQLLKIINDVFHGMFFPHQHI